MALYQFTLHPLPLLEDGLSGGPEMDAPLPRAGQRLELAGGQGVPLVVEVAADGDRAVVTAGPEGWRGRVLRAEGRLALQDGAAVLVLRADGGRRWIASALPLQGPAVLRVTACFAFDADWTLSVQAEGSEARPEGFCQNSLIDTPDGPRPISALALGDLVTTLDNGSQPLRWIGLRVIPPAVMAAQDALLPVLFEAGALGNARPLLVAPQHRMLLGDWRAQVYFGEDQVLVPAQALVNGRTIRRVLPEVGPVCHQLLFDRHEVILAEGVLAESLHPGEVAADARLRQEIEAVLPGLAQRRHRAAYLIVRPAEARGLPTDA